MNPRRLIGFVLQAEAAAYHILIESWLCITAKLFGD
jgi:hypothetical protein